MLAVVPCVAQTADSDRRVVLNGFSLVAPEGWGTQRSTSAVAFGKAIRPAGGAQTEGIPEQSFIILVRIGQAPAHALASPDALEKFVREQILAPSRDRRQTLVSRSVEPFTMQGTDCVRFRMTLEERPRTEVLLMSGAGIVCRHPTSPRHAVEASYSERHAKAAPALPVEAEIAAAEAVMDSLVFRDLD
jgi:hypothetical protein